MNEQIKNIGRTINRLRIGAWTAAALLLLLPLIAMQFTDQVRWDLADFVVFGGMLLAAGATLELATRMTANIAYRSAFAIAIAAGFFMIWVNGAVGIIGNENNPANYMFVAVLAVAIIGAISSRFKAHGMALTMVATALSQALVALIALFAGLGSASPSWPKGFLIITFIFIAMWLISAWLFRNAIRSQI